LYLSVFEQPANRVFFSTLLDCRVSATWRELGRQISPGPSLQKRGKKEGRKASPFVKGDGRGIWEHRFKPRFRIKVLAVRSI
jgi:hypothetical protein